MTREESMADVTAQLDKLTDEALEYLSRWSMPLGVLPMLRDYEDGKLMRDCDCETHVLLACEERDELIREFKKLLPCASRAFRAEMEKRIEEIGIVNPTKGDEA